MSAKKKIFIVEDHPLTRVMLAQLINYEDDMTVCGEADNIITALSEIKLTKPDAAIIDLNLKGSGGLELIKSLKTHHIQLPVLVLSMLPETLSAERVLRAGAKGYISKSATPADVLNAIRKVFDGQV
jgi:DNA-binding NarL/FixJ family response regulator